MSATSTVRILAVTDLSSEGDLALVEAHRRAQAEHAALAVVHAIPTVDAIRPLFPQRLAEDAIWASQLPIRAEATLRERIEALIGAAPIDVFLERGSTADGAIAAIERWRPDLVVTGASDTTAERLVRHTNVSIVVARESPRSGVVLAGTDFSDPSLPAIRAAAARVAQIGGTLVVAHSLEINPIIVYGVDLPPMCNLSQTAVSDAAQTRLDDALRTLGLDGRTVVCGGPPAAGLAETAKSCDAELLVVGTHGRSGVSRFLLGSVAESLMQRAPCSVHVVRMS